MKRFVYSIIIISVIIISSFSVPVYLKNTTILLTNIVDEINEEVENNNLNSALSKTNQLYLTWKNKKNIIDIFVNNNEIDNVTFAIAKLFPLLKYKNIPEFCSNLNYIKSVMVSIYEDDIPSINNIL